MKPLATVIVLGLGIGCLALAMWMGGQAAPPADGSSTKSGAPPAATSSSFPKIAAEGPYPKAVMTQTEHNFGTMLHETKGNHPFTIRNEGAAPLELVALDTDRTCNCTGAKLASDLPLPPGEEMVIDLGWHIKNPNASFRHSAKIRTNDPERPVIELVVKGAVEMGLQYDPAGSVWDLGEVSDQDSIESKKAIFSHAIEHFEIRGAVCRNPRVQCTPEPMDAATLKQHEAKCGYLLHLKVDLTELTGHLSETLAIQTDLDDDLGGELQVKVRKNGPVELIAPNWDRDHSRLFLGEFPAAEGKRAEISVLTRLDEEVNLVSTESEHEAVKIVWEKDERFEGKATKLRRYRLKLEVPPSEAVQRQRGQAEKVTLKFDHPKIGTLLILIDYLSI